MPQTLVVVESPAKAKKIQKYLGSNYVVKASFGHIYDLPAKSLGVDLKTFKMDVKAIPNKKKVISELRAMYKKCNKQLILAPDPDREGEAIGYYVAVCLGADPYATPRISFTEITQSAIKKALQNPSILSKDAVQAQMARRALDRILGYKISPFVKKATYTGRSAGRCQSPSLLLLHQKEDEITGFEGDKTIRSRMTGMTEGDPSPWEVICESLSGFPKINWQKVQWKVSNVSKGKPTNNNPPPPFITSSLLSTAANRLGYGTGRSKKMIQSMYEKGWITYIRTDSTSISKDAQKQIADYLKSELNEKVVPRDYNGKKGKHAQEAHECIRPTNIKRLPADIDTEYQRMYEMIWNRTVASQMSASQSITVSMNVQRKKETKKPLVWKGSKTYCVVAGWRSLEDVEVILPKNIPVPKKGGKWVPDTIVVEEHIGSPPRRYTDATFVSQLEKMGIGRPSTYATIIETIKDRGYAEVRDCVGTPMDLQVQHHIKTKDEPVMEITSVEYGKESKRLTLTDLGRTVCLYLYPTMEDLLGIKSTSSMEDSLDCICSGTKSYEETMGNYWSSLQKLLATLGPAAESSGKASAKVDKKLGQQTIGGVKYNITWEITRYGPAVVRQVVGDKDGKKEYGNIPKGTDVSTLTLDDALLLLPLTFSDYKKQKVVAKTGKFGPYLQIGKSQYISIPKDVWEKGLTQKDVKDILSQTEKEAAHVASLVKSHDDVKEIKKGPRGWYAILSKGKKKTMSLTDSIMDFTKDDLSETLK